MNKKIIAIIVLILLLVATGFTIYLIKRQQELRLKAAPATVLSVSPTTVEKTTGDTFNLNIQIDTGENQVVGADLSLSFNSSVLEALTISPGSFLENPQELTKNIDNQTGKITYSLGSFTPKQGVGTLATIQFQAKAEGTSTLAFGTGTSVAGVGETEALQNTVPGSITVIPAIAPTATPTLTPTPTSQSTTPTPTVIQPTATATPQPATLTPTPTNAPKEITATPIPSPTLTEEKLPQAGNSLPTFFLTIVGNLLLFSALFFLI
jgi:hypothetical protein